MEKMTLKQRYEFIRDNISREPYGTFPCYYIPELPDYMHDDEKIIQIDKNVTYGIELTDKATKQDYIDYIRYVTAYTGSEESFPLTDEMINEE